MVRRRTVLAATMVPATLAGCLTDSSEPGTEEADENESDWTPPERSSGAGDASGPRANVFFERTYADDNEREPVVEVGVSKLGRADELWVTSPDCDLEVALDPVLGDSAVLADDGVLAGCGDEPTLTVTAASDGTEETIATHTVTSPESFSIIDRRGNAGSHLTTNVNVGWFPDGTVAFAMKRVRGATDAWIESPDCSIAIPVEVDERNETTIYPEDRLGCPADATFWVVAADEDGHAIVRRAIPDAA